MNTPTKKPDNGLDELRQVRAESRTLFWIIGIFSFFVNLLMLTGPLFMLLVYDRVLSSRSDETLLALFVIMGFLFLMMGLLDYARGRLFARIGARFQTRLDRRVFAAMVRKSAISTENNSGDIQNNLRDLEAVQRLLSAPVLSALFDVPWTPFFLLGIAIFHPWLGILAAVGGSIVVTVAILNQIFTNKVIDKANIANLRAERMGEQIRVEAEMVRSLGMQDSAFNRWNALRENSLNHSIASSDLTGGFTATTKTFRLFLQSSMLALGAYLVLREQLSPGAMIAGSILMGRALAPIDMAIGQWQLVQRAITGWRNLANLLETVPQEPPRTPLPRPKAELSVEQITVIPPGQHQASLRMVSFDVAPGEAIGVIGSSGSGKSTLARALTGVWRPAGGRIRLGGATLDQYEPDILGQHIGYLPQRVALFDGTIADNISRLAPNPDAEKIVEAARMADAHELILTLGGYDTVINTSNARLSGGQLQRIGLARAMYGDPVLLVLDEPNSNLDNDGGVALNSAINRFKESGRSVLIMAHRPSAIQNCERLLVLETGMRRAFGPRDKVLQEMVSNHQQIIGGNGQGGVT